MCFTGETEAQGSVCVWGGVQSLAKRAVSMAGHGPLSPFKIEVGAPRSN